MHAFFFLCFLSDNCVVTQVSVVCEWSAAGDKRESQIHARSPCVACPSSLARALAFCSLVCFLPKLDITGSLAPWGNTFDSCPDPSIAFIFAVYPSPYIEDQEFPLYSFSSFHDTFRNSGPSTFENSELASDGIIMDLTYSLERWVSWARLFKARLSSSWISGYLNCHLFTVKGGFFIR